MKRIFILVFFAVMDWNLAWAAGEKVDYLLSMPEPQTHYFKVEMHLNNFNKEQLSVKMPVWAPGSYLVREFSKNVESFEAKNAEGRSLTAEKVNKNTWRIDKDNGDDVVITYKVYAFEASVRTSFLDDSHGFVSGSSVFMYVEGYKKLPATLKVIPYRGWKKITTSLEKTAQDRDEFYVPDYDILADSPIEIGNQTVLEFEAEGIPHQVAMYGPGDYDAERICQDIPKIVSAETAIFGENPNKNYTFIIHNVERRYTSGLEHLNSCALDVYRWIYKPEANYDKFLSLVAHEYFHLWVVKRIRPQSLMDYDYDQENYTDLLWVMEGFTSYYDELILRRTGFYDNQEYIEKLIDNIAKLQNMPGDKIEDVAESSFDAWIKYYRHNENSKNSQTDYYTKGAILGAMLDLDIIYNSRGKYRLDDALNNIYYEYYKKGKGINSRELKQVLEHFAGHSLDDFFQNYVFATQDIDYSKYFGYAGVELVKTSESIGTKVLGVSLKTEDNRLIVSSVTRGSAAWKDGLNVNDEVIAIDNFRVDSNDDVRFYVNQSKGPVEVLISRNGLLKTVQVVPQRSSEVSYRFEYSGDPTKLQKKTLDIWLGDFKNN